MQTLKDILGSFASFSVQLWQITPLWAKVLAAGIVVGIVIGWRGC